MNQGGEPSHTRRRWPIMLAIGLIVAGVVVVIVAVMLRRPTAANLARTVDSYGPPIKQQFTVTNIKTSGEFVRFNAQPTNPGTLNLIIVYAQQTLFGWKVLKLDTGGDTDPTKFYQQYHIPADLQQPTEKTVLTQLQQQLGTNRSIVTSGHGTMTWSTSNTSFDPLSGYSVALTSYAKYAKGGVTGNSLISEAQLQSFMVDLDQAFQQLGFTKSTLNMADDHEFTEHHQRGYESGVIRCVAELDAQSSPFATIFCGTLDSQEVSWRSMILPTLYPTLQQSRAVWIENVDGSFARGGNANSYWIAQQQGSQWVQLYAGQNLPACSLVAQNHIPRDIYQNCYRPLLNNNSDSNQHSSASTAAWQTYSSASLKFSVKVPSTWKVSETQTGVVLDSPEKIATQANTTSGPVPAGLDKLSVRVDVYATVKDFSSSAAKSLFEELASPIYGTVETTTVAGQTAYTYNGGGCMAECGRSFAVEYNNHIYRINFDINANETLDATAQAILDSFKFTN